MPVPSVEVTIAAAAISDGSLTATNTALIAYAAADGPDAPVTVRTAADARAAGVEDTTALQHVADLVAQGVPQVVLTRADTATAAASVTADGWGQALSQLDAVNYPLGQVLIPGVGTAAAHEALVAHSQQTTRAVYLDAPVDATAAQVLALAEAQAGSPLTFLAGMFPDWAVVSAGGSATRTLPGSIGAAGATARMDVTAGHSNRAPALTQNTGTAGLVRGAVDVVTRRTIDELEQFADAGINPLTILPGGVFVGDFLSITDDPLWTNLTSGPGVESPRSQLNFGRLAMQIVGESRTGLRQYLFQPNDGQRQLLQRAENYLAAYMTRLWDVAAIYGATADEAFTVNVVTVTTDADVASGRLRAAVEFAPTPAVRHVTLQTTVTRAGAVGAAAMPVVDESPDTTPAPVTP